MNQFKRSRLIILTTTLVACLGLAEAALAEKPFDRQRYEQAIDREMKKMEEGVKEGPYQAEWESLRKHNAAPEWFRDAKFGIYWHWGVYTVPAYGNEWYPKWMHTKEGRRSYYKHHLETYGAPDKFGYHDFVPMFKAEKFDADEWAELCRQAGARYAGPVCEHHDGYSMWASELTPWNVGDTGPKRDIAGELAKAIRKRGMKFITTFHHERTQNWYPRVEGWPTTSDDPKLQMLYMNISKTLFNRIFQTKLGEVIDKYQPDLIWFDGRLEEIQDPYHRRFLAYYFNQAKKWGRDVVVTCKGHDYDPEVAVEDFEKGRMNRLTDFCWLTDDTISMGSWCYTTNLQIKPTVKVLHDFIDIVSKNGCLLLNISPMSDGSIPDNQKEVLRGMGSWLNVNGEAIYNTRPWLVFGEGPTRLGKSGGFVGHVAYSAKDIRYTRSKDGKTLYAIALGWPAGDLLKLQSVLVKKTDESRIALLGYDESLTYRISDAAQMAIVLPDLPEGERPCRHAYVFKLTGFDLAVNSAYRMPEAPKPVLRRGTGAVSRDLILDANEAQLTGPKVQLETKTGTPNIGYWDDPRAQAHWKVQIKKPGTYTVTAKVAAIDQSALQLDLAGATLTCQVPATGGWNTPRTIQLGTVTVDKPGIHKVALRPADPKNWKPINVWRLELKGP